MRIPGGSQKSILRPLANCFVLLKGELCLQTYAAGEIIMGVVGGIAVVLSVVIILAYRNYRYEQELDSLLWKVESSEIKVSKLNILVFNFIIIYKCISGGNSNSHHCS